MREKCPLPTIESVYGRFAPLVRWLAGLPYKDAIKDLDGENEEDKNQDKKECDKNNDSMVKTEVDNDNSNVQQEHGAQPAKQEEQNPQQHTVQRVNANLVNTSEAQLAATMDEAGDDWCIVDCKLAGVIGKNNVDDG